MVAAFSIAWGRTEEHAAQLTAGLARMPAGFLAKVCDMCHGTGECKQTYTAGCGRGYYSSMGGCDYCDGTGLLQGGKPAPGSVRNQVLVASTR